MQRAMYLLAACICPLASAVINVKSGQAQQACAAEDLQRRVQLQNKLAGSCEDMCKTVGSYPKCNCPDFVQPDSTPGVMTWDELLQHMDSLTSWGADSLKAWRKQASALQTIKSSEGSQSCVAEEVKRRAQVQNKLAGSCEDMCKTVGSYPNCNCPNFVQPDSTPGVMTWDELLEHMDSLTSWGAGELKAWRKQASALQKGKHLAHVESSANAQACVTEDLQRRAQLQNQLAGSCEDMCKTVGSYPNCNCPNFVQPDSTPGVMTWDELLQHMDSLTSWGADSLKAWRKQASALQKPKLIKRN